MSQIFIELYLDEDVSVVIADLLRARGFSASTTVEAGNLGFSDHDQLEYAISQHRTLLTHNRADFETLAKEFSSAERTHGGIIIAVRRWPSEICSRLLAILNSMTHDEIQNQVLYI